MYNQKIKEYASASEEIADRAKKFARENKVSYSEAADAICEEDTDLAERYKMEDV